MAKDTIFVDTKKLDRLSFELKEIERQVPGASAAALKRTLDHVVTQVGRMVPKLYAIKTTEVKQSFKGGIEYPNKNNLTARAISIGHTLSFAHFPHTPNTPIIARILGVKHQKSRVRVRIKMSGGKVLSRSGFIASTGAKSADKIPYNVFHRLGKNRLPIAPIRTLSIPQMITNENIDNQVMEVAEKKLSERIEHEIEWRLAKAQENMRK